MLYVTFGDKFKNIFKRCKEYEDIVLLFRVWKVSRKINYLCIM